MDAERIVDLATNWRTLPSQHICQTVIMVPNVPISDIVGQTTRVTVSTDGCQGTLNSVRFLEHVQCKISLRYYPRGNLMITLSKYRRPNKFTHPISKVLHCASVESALS